MANIVRQINPVILDTVQDVSNTTVNFRKGDSNSRVFEIHVMNNGVPCNLTDVVVMVYSLKPDMTKSYILGNVVNASEGIVLAEITSQMLAVEGEVEVRVRLVNKDNTDLSTSGFFYKVMSDFTDDDSVIISTNEYKAFVSALALANKTKFYKWQTTVTLKAGMTQVVIPSNFPVGANDMIQVIYYNCIMDRGEWNGVGEGNYTLIGQTITADADKIDNVYTITNFGS